MSDYDRHVYVVDDDAAIRDSLQLLFRSVAIETTLYESGEQFLDALEHIAHGCVVLDMRMPGLSGAEVHQRLRDKGLRLPVIFITGHGDIQMAVQAMQNGAFDFIAKPFRDQDLLDRVNDALNVQQESRSELEKLALTQHRFAQLTNRERQIMVLVCDGHSNKTVAEQLGVSQRTVEIHRSRIMNKMGVRSLAELVRFSVLLENAESLAKY